MILVSCSYGAGLTVLWAKIVTGAAKVNVTIEKGLVEIADTPGVMPELNWVFESAVRTHVVRINDSIRFAGLGGIVHGRRSDKSNNMTVHFALINESTGTVTLDSDDIVLYSLPGIFTTGKSHKLTSLEIQSLRGEVRVQQGVSTESPAVEATSFNPVLKEGESRDTGLHAYTLSPGSIVTFTIWETGPFYWGCVCRIPLKGADGSDLGTYDFRFGHGYTEHVSKN